MHVLRTRLIRDLQAADRNGNFHVYYPHVDGLAEGTCIDTHSKLMIVDDEWLRVGSANLSNRSMGLDTECDVAIEAGGAPAARQAIRRLRDGLLAEHLGATPDQKQKRHERSGDLCDGSVVISAITSCTNTSIPAVMLAAGLVARIAVAKGL